MAKDFSKAKGTKSILQNIAKAENKPGAKKNEVAELPIEEIIEEKNNDYLYDMDKLEGIAQSIRERGVMTPIRVWRSPDNKYLICAGHRRYRASKMAAKRTIPAIIMEWEPNEHKRRIEAMEDNMVNRNEKPLEKARVLQQYMDEEKALDPSLTEAQLKDMAVLKSQESLSTVRKLLNLLKLIPELQEKAKDNENYPYSGLSPASRLSEKDQHKFNKMIDDLVNTFGHDRLSRSWMEETLRDIKAQNKGTVPPDEVIEEPTNSIEDVFGSIPTKTQVAESENISKITSTITTQDEEIDDMAKTPSKENGEISKDTMSEPINTQTGSVIDDLGAIDLSEETSKPISKKTPEKYGKQIKEASEKYMSILPLIINCTHDEYENVLITLESVKNAISQGQELIQGKLREE